MNDQVTPIITGPRNGEQARATCTCTIPKLKGEGSREVVKPGESTEIELEWKAEAGRVRY